MKSEKNKFDSHIKLVFGAWLLLMIVFILHRMLSSEYRIVLFITNPFSISLLLIILFIFENRRYSSFLKREYKNVWEDNMVGMLKNRLSWVWDIRDDQDDRAIIEKLQRNYQVLISIIYLLFVLTFIIQLIIVNLIKS